MKPEAKLGLGAATVLLVVLGGAYFFVPAEKKPVVDPNARTALAPGHTTVPGGISSEPLLSSPTTMPGDTVIPPFSPTTLPSIAVGPSTQPVTIVPPPTTQPMFGSPGGGSGSTDWNALLAGGSHSGGGLHGGGGSGSPTTTVLPTGPSAGARPGPTPGSSFRPLLPSGPTGSAVPQDSGAVTASTYTVAKGDTLSKISAKVYGNANLWSKIIQANPGLDSTKLKVGQVLRIPAKEEVAPSDASIPRREPPGGSSLVRDPKTEYQVQTGDSLHKIAQRLYGNANRWEEIYNLNKATIGSSPTKLKVGQVLKLPAPPTTPATRP